MIHKCDNTCIFDHDKTKEHLLYHLRNNIPTKITYDEIAILPSRRDFLDAKTAGAFSVQASKGGPMLFLSNDIIDKNEYNRELGENIYKLYMFGITPCGSKTLVILDGVPVYFDVRVPSGISVEEYGAFLRGQMYANKLKYVKITDVHLFPMHGFHKLPAPYKRIWFNNLQDRKEALKFIEDENKGNKSSNTSKYHLETASDDLGMDNYYFQKVARESHFNTAGWNKFTKYTLEDASKYTSNCTYVFRVDVSEFRKLDSTSRRQYATPGNPMKNLIDRDNTVVMSWDIETYSTNESGMMPCPETYDWNVFMINSLYFMRANDKQFYGVCCVDVDTGLHPGTPLTIVCGNEKNVLLAHFTAMGLLAPDITIAFNGSHFDWHNVREKLKRNNLLVWTKHRLSSLRPLTGKYADTEESVNKWCFRNKVNVKIDAENNHEMKTVAVFPGIVDTDAMPVFLKLYPRMEVKKTMSLNFFLASNGLESKEDMPYKTMFRIYERAKALENCEKKCHCNVDHMKECKVCNEHIFIDYEENTNGIKSLHKDLCHSDDTPKCCYCGKRERNLRDMADVGYYCIIDCLRPQQLYVKRTIIADKRELSTMSFVTMYDSFYRADGMKVRNLIGRYSFKRNVAFSNAKSTKPQHEKDHYPGAWVFPPNRGLHSDGMIEVTYYDSDGVKRTRFQRARPIFGEDFASLYPSLMMTYNLSPDMLVYDEDVARQLAAEGYTLHKIAPFDYEKGEDKGAPSNKHLTAHGWTVRHNGITNNKCTNIITEYAKYENFTYKDQNDIEKKLKRPADSDEFYEILNELKVLKIKVSRKPSYEPVYGREKLIGEMMGLFPYIVKKIFDKRVPVKAEFVRWEKLIEEMDVKKTTSIVITTDVDGKKVESTITYADAVFYKNKADSTQKALKVLANTFYGESGNFRSSVYELLVAAGITTAGQYNIKLVAAFVTRLGYTVHYGDTDSVYLSAPDNLFESCDKIYLDECARIDALPSPISNDERLKLKTAARIAWWTAQVEISQGAAGCLMEQIADYLLSDNGTLFLKMAYEEVLFPTVFTGKKKYYGTAHIEDVNFFPKKPFIRGIDIIKQGQAEISKNLGMEFMMESLSPHNYKDLLELALDKIRKYYTIAPDPKLFKLNARFKSMLVKNIPVRTFVLRMRTIQQKYLDNDFLRALYEPPEPGDKFEYLIIKKEQQYTLSGKKIKTTKGDQMEYLHVYNEFAANPDNTLNTKQMEIDLSHYMKNAIIGLFARFIAYHADFQPPGPVNLLDKAEYKKMDQACVDNADKFLNALCDSITGHNPNALKQQGLDYKAAFRRVDKQINEDLAGRYGDVMKLFHLDLAHNDQNLALSTRLVNQITNAAKIPSHTNIGGEYYDLIRNLYSIHSVIPCYTAISKIRITECVKKESMITDSLWKQIHTVAETLINFEQTFAGLIADARLSKKETLDERELAVMHNVIDPNIDILRNVYTLQTELAVMHQLRVDTMNILDAFKQEKARRYKYAEYNGNNTNNTNNILVANIARC